MSNEFLTDEEEQIVRDEPYLYDAYSTPVSLSGLLDKVTEAFEQVPSYVQRFQDGREEFSV